MWRVSLTGSFILMVACTTEEQRVDKGVTDKGVPDESVDQLAERLTPDLPRIDKATADLPVGNPSVWKEELVGSTVNAIWGIDSKNVFAVGKGGLIVRYDGGTLWKTMQNPDKDDLYAVYATGPSAVFAGGDAGILAYDGTAWTNQSSSYDKPAIRGIWSNDTTIFAVGPGGVMRYKNKTGTSTYWSSVYFGSTSGKDFTAIWGVGNDLFAVGKAGLIVKCSTSCTSSSSWTTMTAGTSSDLQGVWGTANNDIFAVGLDGAIVHYNGTAWSVMPSSTSTYFYGVWGVGAKDVYAVGNPIFKPDEAIMHYNGTTWSKVPPPRANVSYLDVWASSATDVWVVGQSGSILHYTGP